MNKIKTDPLTDSPPDGLIYPRQWIILIKRVEEDERLTTLFRYKFATTTNEEAIVRLLVLLTWSNSPANQHRDTKPGRYVASLHQLRGEAQNTKIVQYTQEIKQDANNPHLCIGKITLDEQNIISLYASDAAYRLVESKNGMTYHIYHYDQNSEESDSQNCSD